MSDLDDITKRMKPKNAPEPSDEPKNNYQGLYDASDYAALPGQTISKFALVKVKPDGICVA